MPRNQPYLVRDEDPSMVRLIARIKARGVRQPALVRPDPEGGYEIIDGHRRYRASELAERPDMPVIIRDLSDEEAVAEMVDGNVQRENVLPSERAWAYRMYLEADKKRAGRPAKNSPKISANFFRPIPAWKAGREHAPPLTTGVHTPAANPPGLRHKSARSHGRGG